MVIRGSCELFITDLSGGVAFLSWRWQVGGRSSAHAKSERFKSAMGKRHHLTPYQAAQQIPLSKAPKFENQFYSDKPHSAMMLDPDGDKYLRLDF
jgi:hypothetical protein